MRFPTKVTAFLVLLLLVASSASAATLSVQFMNGKVPVANAPVVAYLSNARLEATTNASGVATFDVPKASYMWLEVNGQRLNQLFREGEIAAPINVLVIGFMTWMGGKKS